MENDDQKISLTEVRGRLFELIFEMTETESRALKEELEKKQQPEHGQKERRKHPRKKTFIHVDCSGNNAHLQTSSKISVTADCISKLKCRCSPTRSFP